MLCQCNFQYLCSSLDSPISWTQYMVRHWQPAMVFSRTDYPWPWGKKWLWPWKCWPWTHPCWSSDTVRVSLHAWCWDDDLLTYALATKTLACWQPNCCMSNPHLFLLHANDHYCLGRDVEPCSGLIHCYMQVLFSVIRNIPIFEQFSLTLVIHFFLCLPLGLVQQLVCIRTVRPK